MKVNHHQIKNAIADISKQVQKDFPTMRHNLRRANFQFIFWRFAVYESSPIGSPSPMTYIDPRYFAFFANIGTDESISLDNLFIETFGIDKALDAGFGFMNHADKITSASLIHIEQSYLKHDPSWILSYSCLDKEQAELEMDISISNQGMIFDIELYYTGGEKAHKIAENFIKQSDEILNITNSSKSYERWNTGIHALRYRGFNKGGEVITLYLKIDVQKEVILSHEITVLKPESK